MTGKQVGSLVLAVGAMTLLLPACGADPTATPTSAPTATAPPMATPTPDEAARFQTEWAALIAAAQEEGEITLAFGGAAGRMYRGITEFFGEKFGITPVVSTGSGTAQVNRVLAERTTGRYLVDSIYMGATPVATRLVPADAVLPMADLFIHPEVTDQSLWYQGKHWYGDPQQRYLFAFAAEPSHFNMSMRYNTDLVTPEDIESFTSVWDYLDPKWKGKIVSAVPTGSGSGGVYYRVYVHPDIGKEWIDAFLSPELEVTWSDDARFISDGVVFGKFHFAINTGGAGSVLESLATLGAPVGVLNKEFKEAGGLGGSGSQFNFVALTKPLHPNAAKLWVNWWLSKEGQTLMHTMAEGDVAQTLRVDVTDMGNVPATAQREEGREYQFFGTDPELLVKKQEAFDYVASVWAKYH